MLFREELDLVAAAGGGRVLHVVGDAAGPLDAALLARLVGAWELLALWPAAPGRPVGRRRRPPRGAPG